MSYGGAAGQHAAAVARRLGISTVLVHPCAAVLSAWGQSLAPREESAVKALWSPLLGSDNQIQAVFEELEAKLPNLGLTRRSLSMRHMGTDHAIEIVSEVPLSIRALSETFKAEHRKRYGFDRPQGVIEVVNAHVRVSEVERPLAAYRKSLAACGGLTGRPKRLPRPTTSIWIPKGGAPLSARASSGSWMSTPLPPTPSTHPHVVELVQPPKPSPSKPVPGERLARSANIRERRDFSWPSSIARGASSPTPHMSQSI